MVRPKNNPPEQTLQDARAEVYTELVGHLQLVYDGFTAAEKKVADSLMKRWLPYTGCKPKR